MYRAESKHFHRYDSSAGLVHRAVYNRLSAVAKDVKPSIPGQQHFVGASRAGSATQVRQPQGLRYSSEKTATGANLIYGGAARRTICKMLCRRVEFTRTIVLVELLSFQRSIDILIRELLQLRRRQARTHDSSSKYARRISDTILRSRFETRLRAT